MHVKIKRVVVYMFYICLELGVSFLCTVLYMFRAWDLFFMFYAQLCKYICVCLVCKCNCIMCLGLCYHVI